MSVPETVQIDPSPGQPVDFEHLARIVVSESKVNCLTVKYLNGITLELAKHNRKAVVNVAGLEPAYPTRLHALVEKLLGTPKSETAHEEVVAAVERLEGCSVIETGRSWVEVDPATRNPSALATRLTGVAESLDCEQIVSVSRRSL